MSKLGGSGRARDPWRTFKYVMLQIMSMLIFRNQQHLRYVLSCCVYSIASCNRFTESTREMVSVVYVDHWFWSVLSSPAFGAKLRMSTKACNSYGGLQLGNGLCSKSLQIMQILCCCVDFPFVQFRNQYDNDVTIWSPQVIGTPFYAVFKVWSFALQKWLVMWFCDAIAAALLEWPRRSMAAEQKLPSHLYFRSCSCSV